MLSVLDICVDECTKGREIKRSGKDDPAIYAENPGLEDVAARLGLKQKISKGGNFICLTKWQVHPVDYLFIYS